jgi:hypothetical protein
MGRRLAAYALALAFVAASTVAHAGYGGAFRHDTRDGKIYDVETWDAKIIWHATFFSDDFRKAYEKRYLELKYLSDEEEQAFLDEQEHRQESGWDFFIGAYMKEDYKKLTSSSDSFWTITLTTGTGEVLRPTAIEQLPVTPELRQFFPYLDRWSKAYRITFPKAPLGNRIEFTATSVIGTSTLSWKLKNK